MWDRTKTAGGHTRLQWKVYDKSGAYVAATLTPTEAAILVSVIGGDVRFDSTAAKAIVWREGVDGEAAESYDVAAETMFDNADRMMREQAARYAEHAAKVQEMPALSWKSTL
jgi:hypothetical protein